MFLALAPTAFINLNLVEFVQFIPTGIAEVFFTGDQTPTAMDVLFTPRLRDYFDQVAKLQRVEPEELDGLREKIQAILNREILPLLSKDRPRNAVVWTVTNELMEALFHPVEEQEYEIDPDQVPSPDDTVTGGDVS